MASTGHRKRNSVITVLSHSHLVQHSSLHSVYSSTGDEVLKKGKTNLWKGSLTLQTEMSFWNSVFLRQRLHTCTRIEVKIHSMVIWKTVISIMAKSVIRRTLHKLWKEGKCLFPLVFSWGPSSLLAPKLTICLAFSRIISLFWWHQQESFWCYLGRHANCYQFKCK